MKRILVALCSAILLTAVSISAQQPPAKPSKPADAPKETTYYGCLVPGSKPDEFRLVYVGIKGQKHDDNVSYKIDAPEKLDVVHFQTMEVEIVGTVVGTGTDAVLKATKISRKSDYCG
jgi:hypothetical protein